jgi:1-acyl-sn-glycerol-3-phosphate acyltransferase
MTDHVRMDRLPRADLAPWRRTARYLAMRAFLWLSVRAVVRVRFEGRDRLPAGPAILCFNHLGWLDPLIVLAALPLRPRLYLFGPKEEDMHVGARNRLMTWSAASVPFKPDKRDLLETTRRVEAVFDAGGRLAIAGEGRIHVHEGDLLPLAEGTAYFALRGGVPIVPIAISGTSWVDFRSVVVVRVGEPIAPAGRPTKEAVDALTWRTWSALRALVDGDHDRQPPGRFGRWLTELFNDWGPGGRAAASAIRGPDPAGVASGILPSEPPAPPGPPSED